MTAVQNIQYAARVLAKNRTHSVLAIGMLALGIGVNTAMFSVINAVLLRESPYGNADRLDGAPEVSPDWRYLAVHIARRIHRLSRSYARVGAR